MERKKLHIDRPIIVEGKYDREKLNSFIDGNIIVTDGFGIFSKKEKLALIRRLAVERGIILLTDSDGAGTVIRSYITSAVPRGAVIQLYIPKIEGKERRKKNYSKAGTLGVEGIDSDRLYEILLPFSREGGDLCCTEKTQKPVAKSDFFADGLSGCDGAESRRDMLAEKLGLPSGMTSNALLAAVNVLVTREKYNEIIAGLNIK